MNRSSVRSDDGGVVVNLIWKAYRDRVGVSSGGRDNGDKNRDGFVYEMMRQNSNEGRSRVD